MDINEIAALLGTSSDQAMSIINKGVELPASKSLLKLVASSVDGKPHVSDEQLQSFFDRFEAEEPGRHPPLPTRRELLCESNHRCGICGDGPPLQFHHILPWAKLKHHDATKMIAICGTCHNRCENGSIDKKSQEIYKSRLRNRQTYQSPPAAIDPDIRRNNDLRALQEIYSLFPRPVVENFLQQAACDRILVDDVSVLDGAIGLFYSSCYHISNPDLNKRFDSFFRDWTDIFETSRSTHHDFQHRGIATRIPDNFVSTEQLEVCALFEEAVRSAYSSLRDLNRFVSEHFPEIDLSASDERTVFEWRSLQARIEKDFEERCQSLES